MLTAHADTTSTLPDTWSGKGWRPKDCTPKEAYRFATLFGEEEMGTRGRTCYSLRAGDFLLSVSVCPMEGVDVAVAELDRPPE